MTMSFSFMPIAGTVSSRRHKSSSEIQVTKVSVSHVLTIRAYSDSKRLLAPSEYTSSSFTAAGHRWSIRYYPRGHGLGLEDSHYISFFLSCADTDDVKARSSLCLLDKLGKVAYTCRCKLYDPTGSLQGVSRFIRRKELEESGHVRDDNFRVRFNISVLKTIVRKVEGDDDVATVKKFVDVPPSDIFQRLGDLLSSGDGADVVFEVDGESISAHRSVLAARSPVFRAELFSPMKEGTAACVWVEDMEPRVFKALLHFVYNDVLPPEMDDDDEGDDETMVMAQHLLVAADRYCLERLKLMCEEKLCSYIDTGSVGTMLALADQHGCHGLQKACLNFLESGGNLIAALLTGGMEEMLSSCPSVKEMLLKCCS